MKLPLTVQDMTYFFTISVIGCVWLAGLSFGASTAAIESSVDTETTVMAGHGGVSDVMTSTPDASTAEEAADVMTTGMAGGGATDAITHDASPSGLQDSGTSVMGLSDKTGVTPGVGVTQTDSVGQKETSTSGNNAPVVTTMEQPSVTEDSAASVVTKVTTLAVVLQVTCSLLISWTW